MNPEQPISPFQLEHTPQVPELLYKLQCSIVLSTFQAGKIVTLSPINEDRITQLARNFNRPMGITFTDNYEKLAIACENEVIQLKNSEILAKNYPKKPNTYSNMYFPMSTNYTGKLDLHDLSYGTDNELYAINTLFSCISTFDNDYNFKSYWKPDFITELKPEDRCHLNGMAMKDGKPKYVTAFNTGNTAKSWQKDLTKTGVLIDVDTNEIILSGLGMPHTPRFINGKLYLLLSATGQLVEVDIENKSYTEVINLNGFVRGMSFYKDYIFIGLSKLRQNSSSFAHLDVAKFSNYAGVAIVHLPTKSYQGLLKYKTSVDEIYDLEILPDFLRPNILNNFTETHRQAILADDSCYWIG
ncbi:TIGR03032 family protein [Winogradskyella psychrotolerans]|uniref:TIGR03032 family protein n=1 Tax=Winogradskyella psychrotolerans TaxID=1344585 RepID=UPI001C06D060|nr:TIGR03032 family protein [Winogradskyella psychrotolerans]MBU2921998.1 TIGR03032 family protein [Winogradskyella psychrotolerans]